MEKGTSILHYTILNKLGEGGMGVVYKARDTKLDRTVALKFLPPHLTKSKKDRKRFIREAKSAAALNHPNICTIHNIDEHEGNQFIVMEYVEGKTLRAKIDSGELTVESSINYAIRITEALAAAHRQEIIHRDIKPENIMVENTGRIKVMDFGLVKLKTTQDITKTGNTVGTLAYMSPEQIQAKQVDHRADLFSLGIILYEMLTSIKPFQGKYEAAISYAIMNEEPDDHPLQSSDIPVALRHTILKCLEKEPGNRYKSAKELAAKLKTFVSSSSGVQQETSTTDSTDSRVQSGNKKWIERVAMVVIPLLAIVGGFLYFNDESTVSEDLGSNRVAVVVFENQTGDSSLDPVGRMAADWLIQGIARVDFVDVVPSEVSLSSYQEGETLQHNIDRISEISGANIIIAGTYYRQDSLISVNPRIYDVSNNEFLIPIDPVQGAVDTPMNVVNNLQQKVMGAMATVFDERSNFLSGINNNPPSYEAYSEFVKGFEQFLGHQNFQGAIQHFKTSFEYDSTFATPLLLQAIAYLNLGQPQKSDSLATIMSGNFRNQLIPANRYMVDWLHSELEGNRQQALNAVREAGKLAPNTGHNYQWGLEALKMNRPAEVIEAYKTLDPETPLMDGWHNYWTVLCSAHHKLANHQKELTCVRNAQRQYPEVNDIVLYKLIAHAALGNLEDILRLAENNDLPEPRWEMRWQWQIIAAREFTIHGFDQHAKTIYENLQTYYENHPPDNDAEHLQRGFLYFDTGQTDKAINNFREQFKVDTDNINALGHYGTVLAKSGEREQALDVLKRLEQIDRKYIYGENYRWMAAIRAQLGEPEKSMDLLKEAHEQGMSYRPLHLFTELEPLFEYPEFIEFMEPKGQNV